MIPLKNGGYARSAEHRLLTAAMVATALCAVDSVQPSVNPNWKGGGKVGTVCPTVKKRRNAIARASRKANRRR